MYIKRYTIASIVLIALIGWYVYAYVTSATMNVDFFGVVLPTLPIAIWVIVPLIILYVASVLHMSFYALLGSLRLRKYDKDYEKLLDAITEAYLLKKERNHQFKTPRYKLLGSIIDNANLFSTQTAGINTDNEKLDSVLRVIEGIRNGNVEDIKKFSLKPTNALVIQNDRNRYKKGDISAEDMLKSATNYDDDLIKEVYLDFVSDATLNAIELYKRFLIKESFFVILARVHTDLDALDISNEQLIALIKDAKLDTKDLIQTSKILSTGMPPEERIKLFEVLSENREDAIESYLYTLFDLEMNTPAYEFLDNTQVDEYLNFKAYRALKESGKNFNINLLV